MDEFVTVNIKGLDELQRKLEEELPKQARKDLRAALRAGANILKQAFAQNAPKASGFLAAHFGIATKMRRDELAGSAFVGPNKKEVYPEPQAGRGPGLGHKQDARTAAMVARFNEFGTSKMPKRPFMTQAFESNKGKVLDAIVEKLRSALFD